MSDPIQNSAVAANDNTSAQLALSLNPRMRPQRLFQKVEIAMRIAKKKLEDPSQTTFSEWISDEDMKTLRLTIRDIIHPQALVSTTFLISLESWHHTNLYIPAMQPSIPDRPGFHMSTSRMSGRLLFKLSTRASPKSGKASIFLQWVAKNSDTTTLLRMTS